jgi:uncharacterized protein YqhQ
VASWGCVLARFSAARHDFDNPRNAKFVDEHNSSRLLLLLLLVVVVMVLVAVMVLVLVAVIVAVAATVMGVLVLVPALSLSGCGGSLVFPAVGVGLI